MKVFISWSGDRSRRVAQALRDWLPYAINAIEPWMSAEDIAKGARWNAEVAAQLSGASFGLICLTAENQSSPWILFEAGALSKTLENTYVVPYLLGLSPADLRGPLTQFQAAVANQQDTMKLVVSINRLLEDRALPESRLLKAFDQWWPELQIGLEAVPNATSTKSEAPSERELLEESVLLLRQLAQRPALPPQLAGPVFVTEGPSGFTSAESNPAQWIDTKDTVYVKPTRVAHFTPYRVDYNRTWGGSLDTIHRDSDNRAKELHKLRAELIGEEEPGDSDNRAEEPNKG